MASYGHRWRVVRRQILDRDDWTCVVCGRRAVTVDHIVPADEAPSLMFEPSNLRATCWPHNGGRVSGRLARMAHINRSAAKVRDW